MTTSYKIGRNEYVLGSEGTVVVADPPRVIQQRVARLQRETMRLREQLAQMAHYRDLAVRDHLTGLFNRRYFDERLEQEWSRARRHGTHLAVAVVDLDDFKRINDLAGHAAGDAALRVVARTLEETGREYDIVARIGGDEFAFILPHTGWEGAETVVGRASQTLESQRVKPALPAGLRLRLSYGIAELTATTSSPQELIMRADAAMYDHKRSRHSMVQPVSGVRRRAPQSQTEYAHIAPTKAIA